MPYSEAQKKATINYRKKHYSPMFLDVPRVNKARYVEQAKKRGLSLTAYIVKLLEEDAEMLKSVE